MTAKTLPDASSRVDTLFDLLALACVVPMSLFVIIGLGLKVLQDERR